MPTTITINLQMSYRCKIHTDVELSGFQPMNGSTFIEPCIKCVQEKDALYNQIVSLQNEFNKYQLTKLEQTKLKTRKNKRGEYLKGGKK
jgi:hypothetical protein